MTVTEAHALAVTFDERIRLLVRIRQAYRRSLYRAEWTVPRRECESELRALLRLRRHAKRIARAAQQPRNVDYHTWQSTGPMAEDELFAGYGTDPVHIEDGRREGDPAFNGAFR